MTLHTNIVICTEYLVDFFSHSAVSTNTYTKYICVYCIVYVDCLVSVSSSSGESSYLADVYILCNCSKVYVINKFIQDFLGDNTPIY